MKELVVGLALAVALLGILLGAIWDFNGGDFVSLLLTGIATGVLGVFLFATIASLVTPTASWTRECPHCKSAIRRDASVCPHCRRESEAWTHHKGYWWVKRPSGYVYLDERTGRWILVPPEEVARQLARRRTR